MMRALFPLFALALAGLIPVAADGFDGRKAQSRFDYYVLVLSWTPTYCEEEGEERGDQQCDARRPHRFTLHGLWPQYFDGWPQDCWRGKRPWVPDEVIASMRDIMPSKGLVIHEYRTHGTCAGLSPSEYYRVARELYQRIETPSLLEAIEDRLSLPPEQIEEAFLGSNSWLKPEMVSVTCRKGAFLDVRICFGRDLSPRACGKNEEKRICRAPKVTVPQPDDR
jgi:ribonuclease T2